MRCDAYASFYTPVARCFLKYFYEAGESDEDVDGRDTEVIYYNVSAVDTLAVGSTVKAGELIRYINGNTMCDNNRDNSSYISDPYLHLEVYIDKDGFGWEYVDPIPLLENKAKTDGGGEDE